MIIDLIAYLALLGAMIAGLRAGLLKTVLATAGYIVGGVAGLYFGLKFTHSPWIILIIIISANILSFIGKKMAKGLRKTIVRGPLALLDRIGGAAIELFKIALVIFILGTILLASPWTTGQNAVSKSKVYLELSQRAPSILKEVKSVIERELN